VLRAFLAPRKRRLPFAVLGVLVVALSVGAAGVSAGSKAESSDAFTATALTPDSTYSAPKSLSGAIANTDPSLLGQSSSAPVNVMLKYDFDATASYTGDVAGLAATSPEVTGKALADNAAAVSAYESYAAAKTSEISSAVEAAVPAADIGRSFKTVYGGVQATVPANSVAALLNVAGVAAVQRDTLQQPQDDNTAFIGATNVWPSLGGQDKAASNVIVGVLDTGIWPENPMFVDRGLAPLGRTYPCQFGDGTDVAHLGPTFTCNNKLVGAYAFLNTNLVVTGTNGQEFCNGTTAKCSARDSEGHGTHTTSTAAGSRTDSALLYGVQRGPVSGIAPGARVIMYRVCDADGCFNSDSVAAVQQAIADGVNVINFSIGGGANPYTDPVELAFLDATNAGISVNASAGNSGPGAATAEHGGPWTTTVGASTGPRSFLSTLHLTADGGATFDVPGGVTLTNGISTPTPVVLAQNIPGEDALCQAKLPAMAAVGKVVLCQRGVNGRIAKGFNVAAGNATGMILYNAVKQDQESDNHYLPAIHVDGPPTAMLAFVNTHTNVKATWAAGQATPSLADMMASFSSRGPLGDFIKPDVTAPGVQVLAGMTPQPDQTTPDNGPPGNLFQAIAGTSMSSPHSAGVSALVKAAHPDWTPEMIKSALMTSSVQTVVKEDGVTPAGPFDMGAGSIRADRAVNPTLVFDETFAHFVASAGNPLHRIDLNLASVDATTMTGQITTTRTAKNVSGSQVNMAVSVTQPAGVTITVGNGNRDLHFAKGGTLTFPITISATNAANGQYLGRINLTPKGGGTPVTMPVAFVKKQGTVSLTNSCAPTTITTAGVSHCLTTAANLGTQTANATLDVAAVEKGRNLLFSNVSAPGTLVDANNKGIGAGVHWAGALTPAVAPQVTSLALGTGPAGGYLPLSAFGITPIAGVGDDTITNFNVPTFMYGGEPYTRIGVVSNGYLVLGGGTSSDIVFTPQTFPNPNRPNNVIAPFWSDLNPSVAGSIRIGTLTDGVSNWIIVDWAGVRNFSNATTHTFETWLRTGTTPASEQVTISYATTGAGDPDSGTNWGVENRDGSSGKNIPAPGPANNSEYRAVLAGPTPGGQVSINYDLTSELPGVYHSLASLTSDQTPGVTQVSQQLTVTP
jgi:hypothetical protein